MAAPNRWAVREAAEATFFDTVTGNAIVSLKTLKMSNVETSGETVYARGGRGNAKIVGFSSNREAKVSLQDAIFDNKALAMLTGNTVTTGTTKITGQYTGMTDATGQITVPGTNLTKVISVHQLESDGITLKEAEATVSFTGQVVTATGVVSKLVRVYFEYTSGSDAKVIKVTSDKFGGTFKLVVDVIVKSEETGQEHYAQFIADRVKIEDNFSFNFSPEGDPSVLDIPLEILKNPANTDMWQLKIY